MYLWVVVNFFVYGKGQTAIYGKSHFPSGAQEMCKNVDEV
jgi:hypothetical protein